MLWIHGGPFSSFNSWSWRWNPWVAVAHGWAVLMPDPALSTGYGPDFVARAWPHRAGPVWADLEALLDAVVVRSDVDGERTACLGASFGGYMTNWVAGHTDRFGAIVTHSGTWALDQKNDTADVAHNWLTWFGRPADHPDWYADNSPHHFADRISTPMLITHGNRDYRVPFSEALRLWWDLVSRWDGEPADAAAPVPQLHRREPLDPLAGQLRDLVRDRARLLRPARPRPPLDPIGAALGPRVRSPSAASPTNL